MPADRPVVLITGASSGLGRDVATQLLAGAFTVYAVSLPDEGMQALTQTGARAIPLDVRDGVAVDAAVARIITEEGRIDVLFNNAGYGQYGFIECVTMEAVQRQFDVNVLGYVRFIQAVLPHMRRQRTGRIVNMSSVCSHITMPGMGWYAASKHAVRAMTESLRHEVESFGIHVIAIEPGAVATGFQGRAMGALEATACHSDYAALKQRAITLHDRIGREAASSDSTVAAVLDAISNPIPKSVYRTTRDARIAPHLHALLGARRFGNLLWRRFRASE
jgi:NAD(P)-dependent dehydrogenase (short-subunit alcohol dehydrogenase family)